MIKKIGIVAKNKNILHDYKKEICKSGFKYGLRNADVILCMGGDGTVLEAERNYPKVPKLIIKDSKVCNTCNINLFDNFLDLLIEQKYHVESYDKIECYVNSKKTRFLGINDIIIRNRELTQAIRFDIYIDDKKLVDDEIIGDGIVVSTPFGSTAYHRSITKKTFKKGLGLALNNTNQTLNSNLFDGNTKIKFIINRGKAIIGCDNYRQKIKIKPYDEVLIKLSKEKANIIKLK
jgi:NAD+ kinase